MSTLLVHIIDNDPEVLDSVAFMLRSEDIETTRHGSTEAFQAAMPRLEPGCILMDLRLPGIDGLTMQRRLHAAGCRMPVIIMTGHGDVASAVSAMKEGAVDFIQKPFAKSDLLAALNAAHEQIEHPLPTSDERHAAEALIARLTRREHEVLAELIKGHPNKTIAYDLGISPRTVEVHRANTMKKLEVHSLPEMLHIAFLAGMMELAQDGG